MGNSARWLRPRGVRRAARCPGLVAPQPMRGGGGRNGAGTRRRIPTRCPWQRTPCPSRIHQQATAISWDDAVDRHRLASPTGPTSRLRHGQHVAPAFPSPQGAWAYGDRGKPTGQRAGSGPPDAVFAQTASRMPILRHVGPRTPWPRHSGHRRNDHAVLQRPRRIHTGVALPGRSHVRVCRPALMLCLVHISGIRCLAVLAVLGEQCTRHGLTTAVPGTTNREGIPLARCPSAGEGSTGRAHGEPDHGVGANSRLSTPGWQCAPHLRLQCSTLSGRSP